MIPAREGIILEPACGIRGAAEKKFDFAEL